MANVSGEVVVLNSMDVLLHPVGAAVLVKAGRTPLGVGEIDEDNCFSIDIEPDFRGELTVHVARRDVSEATAIADGADIHVTLFYNGVNNFIAG